jgi:hypothetical protein
MVRVLSAIDCENISHKLLSGIEALAVERGEVVCRRAFGDFTMPRMKPWQELLGASAYEQIDTPHIRSKNVADMALVIDVIDEIYKSCPDVVILGTGDGDFVPLVTRLRSKGIEVIGVGTLEASRHFRDACTEFKTATDLSPSFTPTALVQPLPKHISKTLLRIAGELMRNSRRNDWIAISMIGDAISNGHHELNLKQAGIGSLSEAISRHPNFEVMRDGKNVYFRRRERERHYEMYNQR